MYRLNSEEKKIIDRASKLADESLAPHASRVDSESTFPTEGIRALGDAGFLGLNVPEEYGGMGQGPRVGCAVLDEFSQRCASTGMIYMMHLCGIACYNAKSKTTAKYLEAAAKGDHLSTLAWSERGSRSHFWAPVSRAEKVNGQIHITADKSFVTSAGIAAGYVVSTGWADGTAPTESMLYLVLAEDAGLDVSGSWDAHGMRGNASAPMKLERVSIPSDRALSDEGKGFDTMLGVVLPWFQIGNAAISVGIAEAAVQATTKHLTSSRFEHLGSTLSELPNLRARLARMRIETDRGRAHLVSVIDSVEQPNEVTQLLVLEAKAAASETAMAVTEIGMRACGGAAFGRRVAVERHFRDARASGIMAPTTDVAHEFIGRALCGMELF